MSFQNIPAELQSLKQWVIWKYEETDGKKPTKVPYTAWNTHASVSDEKTWCSFDEAISAMVTHGASGIGFVFSNYDPFAGIDLDALDKVALKAEDYDRMLAVQGEVFRRFDSYTEYSPSGLGMHIIIRAALPGGRKRGGIEIYSRDRFFTFTGNVYHNRPIQDRQGMAEVLYNQMGKNVEQYYYDGHAEEQYTDERVIELALAASNGDKFAKLLTEEWRDLYPDAGGGDQSRADFAFIDIIAYYTQNRAQLKRIFRKSTLGQRRKASRDDYVDNMINKSFDRQLPPLDMDGLYNSIEEQKAELAAKPAVVIHEPEPARGVPYPRGLMGEIARFIYSASPLPVHEISLAAAIGLMSGMCGRSYNVSGTGVNMYTLMLARTGRGKEAMSNGISALVNACTNLANVGTTSITPSLAKFVGPSFIASAQGLHKDLSVQPSFLSIVGEFGLRMQNLASPKATSNDINLKAMLLELYHKSGRSGVLGKMSYSDTAKNVASIQSPAFSMLAESTPSTFLRIVDEELISSGLLPRFLTIIYEGKRNDLNEAASLARPSFELTDKLGKLAVQAHMLSGQGTPIDVMFDPEALHLARDFQRFSTDMINQAQSGVMEELWNRAHIKLLRLASLVAIGVNPISPVVTKEDICWAYELINRDIMWYRDRFAKGETGAQRDDDNLAQMHDLFRVMVQFVTKPYDEIKSYNVGRDAHMQKLISHSYIMRRLTSVRSFKLDKQGASSAIKRVLTDFVSSGTIVEIPTHQLRGLLGDQASGKFYILRDLKWAD